MNNSQPAPEAWFWTIHPRDDGTFRRARVAWTSPAEAVLTLGAVLRGEPQPYPASPWARVFDVDDAAGELVDFAAWLPGQAGTWWTYRNTPILGEAAVEIAWGVELPLLLLETPEAWLDHVRTPGAYGLAACVLDWFAPLDLHLAGCREIVAATPQLERILEHRLVRAPLPRFRVRPIASLKAAA